MDFNFDFTPAVQISLKILDLHLSYFLEKSCALCPASSESSIKFGNHGLESLAGLGNGIGDFQFRDDDPDQTWDVCIIVEFLESFIMSLLNFLIKESKRFYWCSSSRQSEMWSVKSPEAAYTALATDVVL